MQKLFAFILVLGLAHVSVATEMRDLLNKNYHLMWDIADGEITFTAIVKKGGWVGLGLNDEAAVMHRAELVIAGMEEEPVTSPSPSSSSTTKPTTTTPTTTTPTTTTPTTTTPTTTTPTTTTPTATTPTTPDESTTDGSTDESTTDGSTDESTTDGSTDESTTGGSTDESTTGGSTDESTTDGSTDESTTDGSTDESTTDGSTDEPTDEPIDASIRPRFSHYRAKRAAEVNALIPYNQKFIGSENTPVPTNLAFWDLTSAKEDIVNDLPVTTVVWTRKLVDANARFSIVAGKQVHVLVSYGETDDYSVSHAANKETFKVDLHHVSGAARITVGFGIALVAILKMF